MIVLKSTFQELHDFLTWHFSSPRITFVPFSDPVIFLIVRCCIEKLKIAWYWYCQISLRLMGNAIVLLYIFICFPRTYLIPLTRGYFNSEPFFPKKVVGLVFKTVEVRSYVSGRRRMPVIAPFHFAQALSRLQSLHWPASQCFMRIFLRWKLKPQQEQNTTSAPRLFKHLSFIERYSPLNDTSLLVLQSTIENEVDPPSSYG